MVREYSLGRVAIDGWVSSWRYALPTLPIVALWHVLDWLLGRCWPIAPDHYWSWQTVPLSIYARLGVLALFLNYLLIFVHIAQYRGCNAYAASLWWFCRRLWRWSWVMMGTAVLLALGFSFYLLPLFWVWVRTVFADLFALLADTSAWGSLKASMRLTKGHWWMILLTVTLPLTGVMAFFLLAEPWLNQWQPSGMVAGPLLLLLKTWMMLFYACLRLRAFEELAWVHDCTIHRATAELALDRKDVSQAVQASLSALCRRLAEGIDALKRLGDRWR